MKQVLQRKTSSRNVCRHLPTMLYRSIGKMQRFTLVSRLTYRSLSCLCLRRQPDQSQAARPTVSSPLENPWSIATATSTKIDSTMPPIFRIVFTVCQHVFFVYLCTILCAANACQPRAGYRSSSALPGMCVTGSSDRAGRRRRSSCRELPV